MMATPKTTTAARLCVLWSEGAWLIRDFKVERIEVVEI